MKNWLLLGLPEIVLSALALVLLMVDVMASKKLKPIVLILTIYFTASTPALKSALYGLVPASKRERFSALA